jgi:hypothetical protein
VGCLNGSVLPYGYVNIRDSNIEDLSIPRMARNSKPCHLLWLDNSKIGATPLIRAFNQNRIYERYLPADWIPVHQFILFTAIGEAF